MKEIEDQPYRPPGWVSVRRSEVSSEGVALPQTSVAVMLLLMVVTLGLYFPIWFLRRRKTLNALSADRGINGALAVYLSIYAMGFLVGFISGVLEGSEATPLVRVLTQVLNVAAGITGLVLSFKVKDILESNYPDDISGVGTFFLSIFYLQYKINRLQPKGSHGSILGLNQP